MDFTNKVVIVTGAAQGIGRCIAETFQAHGAIVCSFDVQASPYFVGDLSQEEDIRRFCSKVIQEYGRVDYLINNAAPLFKGLPDCTWQEFNYALQVGVAAPYLLTRLLMEHFAPGAAIVNISSSRDHARYRVLHSGERRHSSSHPCPGRLLVRASTRELHFSRLD